MVRNVVTPARISVRQFVPRCANSKYSSSRLSIDEFWERVFSISEHTPARTQNNLCTARRAEGAARLAGEQILWIKLGLDLAVDLVRGVFDLVDDTFHISRVGHTH